MGKTFEEWKEQRRRQGKALYKSEHMQIVEDAWDAAQQAMLDEVIEHIENSDVPIDIEIVLSKDAKKIVPAAQGQLIEELKQKYGAK